jgi:voltage-gated sodium channel
MFGRTALIQHSASSAKLRRSKSDADLLLEVIQESESKKLSARLSARTEVKRGTPFVVRCYRRMVDVCHELVYGKYEVFWMALIVAACVLTAAIAGWNTYPTSPRQNILIDRLNNLVLAIFCFEIFVKLIAAGNKPWTYWIHPVHGSWNTFDFIVTILSVPGIVGKDGSFVKIFRILRLLEQLQKIPAMKAIVMGLIAGIKSIAYILMLLLLVFYLYAALGVFMFNANNPFCFSSIPNALVSLFRGMTLENWEIMMFIDVYGCDAFNGQLYYEQTNSSWAGVFRLYQCRHPSASPIFATVYWVSFIVIAAFVVLSLFIGVITLHMQDAINTVRLEREEVCLNDTAWVVSRCLTAVEIFVGGEKETTGGANRRLEQYSDEQCGFGYYQ